MDELRYFFHRHDTGRISWYAGRKRDRAAGTVRPRMLAKPEKHRWLPYLHGSARVFHYGSVVVVFPIRNTVARFLPDNGRAVHAEQLCLFLLPAPRRFKSYCSPSPRLSPSWH